MRGGFGYPLSICAYNRSVTCKRCFHILIAVPPIKAPTKMKLSTRQEIERWNTFPRRKTFVFLLVANLIDLCLTSYAILSGTAEEVNPLMAAVIDAGIVYFAMVKIAGMQLALTAAYIKWLKDGKVPLKRTWPIIVGIYGFVIVWNTVMITLGHMFPEGQATFPS